MRKIRIYYPHSLQTQQTIILENSAANHVARVLRLNPADPLTIFNGQGGEYDAVIDSISKNKVTVNIQSFKDLNIESSITIHIGQVIARGEKMDLIIQKAVELGVTDFTLLYSERCEINFNEQRLQKKMEHWQGIIIAASEQCGRNKLMSLNAPSSLISFLTKQQYKQPCKLIMDPQGNHSLTNYLQHQDYILIIGPEGGFSQKEIDAAIKYQFFTVNLGDRILRTETAALAVTAVLQFSK